MIIWLSGGFIAWISCVLFMLAIIRGGHRVRGNAYEQKLYLQSMPNTQNRKEEGKRKGTEKTTNGIWVTDRRSTERRSMERRITEGSIADRIITEGVPILNLKRLKQRRLGQRRNMEVFGWQTNPSLN